VTLRARLVVALAAAGVAVLLTAGVVVTSQRHYLLDQLDRQLVRSSPPAARLVETPATAGASGAPFASPTNLPSDLFETYLALVSADGEELRVLFPGLEGRGSPSLAGLDLARLAAEGTPVTVDAVGRGGSYRLRVVDGRAGLAVVALPLDRLEASVARLLLLSAIGAGVILGLLGLLGWWVVRLGLRPIRAMTAAADAIAAGDLRKRVDQLPAATEAGRLARAFNLMLDERQGSEERLRRFVADASHELRTPLTSIRGYIALYRRGALADPERLDDAMRRVGQEAGRMSDLVEDLLLLARLDEGRPLADHTVDLTMVLRDVASDATAVHHDRPFHLQVGDSLLVRGDEDRLRQVFGALVTNALVHTGATVAVALRAQQTDGACVVEVVDEGPGMAPDLANQAFERFVRGDPSRSRHQGGSGLGLAIVRSVVESHGGVVQIDTAEGLGTTVRVTLPRPRPPEGPGPGQLALRGTS